MKASSARGLVYRCPVCGAEIAVIGIEVGAFDPHCCNQPMVPQRRRLIFYFCEVCGAEVAVLAEGSGDFEPVCCNEPMKRLRRAA